MKLASAFCIVLAACGTLADSDESGGKAVLPSAAMGPFRALKDAELKGTAPFVLDDARALYTDPATLADGSDVVLYAVTGAAIVRTRSSDGRTFYGNGQVGKTPPVVLRADQPWERGAVGGPFAFRRGAEVLLYYAAAEAPMTQSIGVARSTDGGLTFVKEPGPILADAHAPTVFALPDGRLRMLYARGSVIEEAESADGVAWARLPGAVLAPSGEATAFDAVAVDDPCVATRTTPAGRFHVRVLYTGRSALGATAIGFAARYGSDGPLSRNSAPAYPTGAAPAYAAPFLYVTQAHATYPAIAGAIEPLDATLPPPSDYPPTP